MSDPPKFSFGTPSSSSTTFGGIPKSTGTSGSSIFGTSGGAPAFAGFGNSTANTTSAGSTAGLFSGLGASSAQATNAGTASAAPAFSWGGPPTSTGATSLSTAASAPSLFGSTTPAAPKTGGFSFGSTTPAGEPPKETPLNASTGATAGSTIFGGPKNLFGQQPTSSVPGPAAATKPSLFGPQPQSTGQSGISFGTGQASGGSSLGNAFTGFGVSKSNAPPAAPTPSTASNIPSFSFTTSQANAAAPSTSTSTALFAPKTGTSTAPGQDGQKPLFGFAPVAGSSGSMPEKPPSSDTAGQKATTFSFPSTTSSAVSSSTAAPAAPTFSGFNLGGTVNTASTSAAAIPAITTAASGFSFLPTSSSTSQAPASISTAPAFPSFSPAPTTTTSSSQPSTIPSAFPAFTVGGASTSAAQPASTSAAAAPATTSSTAPSLSTAPAGLTASTSGPVPPSQSRLKNKTMDEILTRWATDLTKYTKDFRSSAEIVATWDQHLVDNMSKISKLYSQTLTAERQTESVEMQLSAVENQQAELESWLNVYEKQVEEMLERENKGQSEVGGPDSERERTYRLSEKLGERLEEMGTDLESLVGEINAANASLSRNGKQDEPITQIVRILNSHLTQLKAIDDGAAALNAKVEKAQKSLGSLGYSNGGANGNGTAAVDDFYKSYLGRRS